ncbi:MAG: hypothetical protein ACXAAH_01010 [Promethearchaeota archaeon]
MSEAPSEILDGILISTIVSTFAGVMSSLVDTGIIPSYFILFFHLLNLSINVRETIVFIEKIQYWATSYSLGWLVGVIILADYGLLTNIDILISIIIPIVFIILRFVKRWRGG